MTVGLAGLDRRVEQPGSPSGDLRALGGPFAQSIRQHQLCSGGARLGTLQAPVRQRRQRYHEHARKRRRGPCVAHRLPHGARHPGRHRGLLRLRPPRPDQEHDHDDHAEEHPAVDQVVDADRELVPRQVPQHHDHVGAHPVGDDRHRDRHADEDQPALRRAVVQVCEQGADHERRDQVAHAAAGLDHRPVARRDDELHALAVHRDAGPAQRQDGGIGRPGDHRRRHELADGHGKKHEAQREHQLARHGQAQHRGHGQHEQRDQRELRRGVHRHQFAQQPQEADGRHRQQHPGLRARPDLRQRVALAPGQPHRDRRHQEGMREGVGARPDLHHRHRGVAVQQQHRRPQQQQRRQRAPPRRADVQIGGDRAHASGTSSPAAGALPRCCSKADRCALQL